MSEYKPSVSTSLFLESAEGLALRLEKSGTEAARGMAKEARELTARFRGWETIAPAREVRVATIQQLFDLNRRAMDYLSSR